MKPLAILACLAAATLSAQTKQDRGKRVVDEALAALGGEKFLRMKDRVESGRAYAFYRDRLTGLAIAKMSTDYGGKGPVTLRERQAFGKDEDYYYLFNDKGAYEVTFRGARPMPEDRYTRWLATTRNNILYILHERVNETGMIFESQGSLVWQNTPVEIVHIIDADNNVVKVYFQQSSKLPIRSEFVRRDPKTKEKFEEVTIYAKYRDVSGVQWPYNITSFRNGDKVFELYSENVAINQNLADELFTVGGKTKLLPGPK
jgi:hypothetical protein